MGPLEQDTQSNHPYDGTALRSLRERLEKATGPSYELNVAMLNAIGWYSQGDGFGMYETFYPDASADGSVLGEEFKGPFNFTESVDAAIALVERVLPGWKWNIRTELHASFPDYAVNVEIMSQDWPDPLSGDGSIVGEGHAQTAPLAILIALINALLSETDEPSQQQASVEPETGSES